MYCPLSYPCTINQEKETKLDNQSMKKKRLDNEQEHRYIDLNSQRHLDKYRKKEN